MSASSVVGESSKLRFLSDESTTRPNDIFKVLYEHIKTNQTRSLELFRTVRVPSRSREAVPCGCGCPETLQRL